MPFTEFALAASLRRNLARMGYDEPTAVQAQAMGPAMEGRDVLAIARTGSGKTAAFILPLAESLLRAPTAAARRGGAGRRATGRRQPRGDEPRGAGQKPRSLVLCPTRELAVQVAEEATNLVSGSVLRVLCVHGKVAIAPQAAALADGVDLIVATPGRCQELLDGGSLDLSRLRHVVLDEADRMLDLGFEPQVRAILATVPSDRQTLLFSATMPEPVARLADDLMRHPVRLDVDPTNTPVGHVAQRAIRISQELKVPLLRALLAGAGVAGERRDEPPLPERTGVLVFCRTRRRAHWIGTALRRHGVTVGFLHGDRSHAQRQRALRSFARGEHRVLVATDVAARGLHVPAVRTVINYDVVIAPEEHVHRIGRAAHGLEGRGGVGEAITFLTDDDRALWSAVAAATGATVMEEPPPSVAAYMEGVPKPPPQESDEEENADRRDTAPSRTTAGRREGGRDASRERRQPRREDSNRPLERRSGRDRASVDAPPRRRDDFRRPKKSRPIKKGQKPGGGVRRIDPA